MVAIRDVVEQVVGGLGYDLVELERSAAGLLRVTIDWPWLPGPDAAARLITLDDCEKVTRQLQFALEVEGVPYQRLEVSSPGIDRPLRSEQDFVRFAGQVVDITLKAMVGASAAAAAQTSATRKKFRGTLQRLPPEAQQGALAWRLVWRDAPALKPGQRVSKKKAPAPLQTLSFSLEQLREARLAPVVSFKGRAGPGEALQD